MTAITTLETAKLHLRVEDGVTVEDTLIELWIAAAEKAAADFCNRNFYLDDASMGADADGLVLPDEPAVQAAVLLTLGHLYENRTSVDTVQKQELPLGVASLLQPHRINIGM